MSEKDKLAKSIQAAEADIAEFDKLLKEKAHLYTADEIVLFKTARADLTKQLTASKALLAKHS